MVKGPGERRPVGSASCLRRLTSWRSTSSRREEIPMQTHALGQARLFRAAEVVTRHLTGALMGCRWSDPSGPRSTSTAPAGRAGTSPASHGTLVGVRAHAPASPDATPRPRSHDLQCARASRRSRGMSHCAGADEPPMTSPRRASLHPAGRRTGGHPPGGSRRCPATPRHRDQAAPPRHSYVDPANMPKDSAVPD